MKIPLWWWLPLAALAQGARAQDEQRVNDFPTVERVQYVEACMREHPDRSKQEMVYKCSCALDVVASLMSYEEYVDASTAYFAGQTAGERGVRIRESDMGRTLIERYRTAQEQAMKQCLISKAQ
jgi:hypothetical protein